MIRFKIKSVLWLLLIFGVIVYFRTYLSTSKTSFLAVNENLITTTMPVTLERNDEIIIVVVVCGQRTEEALVMMKSAVIFQRTSQLQFIILCEFNLRKDLNDKLQRLRTVAKNSFSYELLNLSFPEDRQQKWKTLFKPCAAQRLFLPNILTNISNILYVDTDVIFLNELSDIWRHVHSMNSSQMSALVLEHEDPNIGWYSRFARHPFYGRLGVNSAVMLMNLTKMREFKWTEYMGPILNKFELNLTWGDQDIINIIFHYHPDKLYIYSCRYNYRPDHCMYKSICKDAEENGITVMHGSRGTFHLNKQSPFKAIFQAFLQYELDRDPYENLVLPLKRSLLKTMDSNCGTLMNIFLKNLVRLFAKAETTSSVRSVFRASVS